MDPYLIELHSTVKVPTPPAPEVIFWEVLRSFPNQSLFEHFTCDDDGEWIRLGLMLALLSASMMVLLR